MEFMFLDGPKKPTSNYREVALVSNLTPVAP